MNPYTGSPDFVIDVDNIDADLIPDTDDTYDFGSALLQWRNGYFDGTLEADAITIGGTAIGNIYLKLDCSNDPLTNDLEIQGKVTATGLYDVDADTSVRAESTADRDKIDFYEGGEHLMEADGGSVFFNPNRGDLDFIVGHRGTLYNTIWYNAGTQNLSFNGTAMFNQQRQDVDFTIRKETAGDAYNYNAGTDIHTFMGNVGIGTAAPGQLLHIKDGDLIVEDNTPWYGGFDSDTSDGWIWHINTNIASAPWQGLTLRRVDGTATTPTVTDILMHFGLTNDITFPTGDVYVNNTLDVNDLETDSLNVDGLTTLDETTIDGAFNVTAPNIATFDWYIDSEFGIRMLGNVFIDWYVGDVHTAKMRSTGGGDFTIGAINENIILETGVNGTTDRLLIEADGDLIFNPNNNDDDFSIYKNTAGIAFVYDAGDDNTSIGDIVGGNILQISDDGDTYWEGTGGLTFGEIYVVGNAVATTLNAAAEVQLTVFDTDGLSNNTTPDHTNDHITITKAGIYLATVSIHVNNNAAQTHIIDVSVFKNNGTVELVNVHGHRTLTGGSGDVGSMSLSGIIDLAVSDTIEMWATTDAAADRSVTFVDITLSLVQIGGT